MYNDQNIVLLIVSKKKNIYCTFKRVMIIGNC